jgi:hypothetical protein
MYQVRSRQIARLEKRALPYIEQRGEMEQQWRQVRRGVVAHATVLAFLVRYGNPQVDEGLSDACRRFAKSEAWKACCEKFPESCKNYRDEFSFEPYNRDRVFLIGDPLRHILISTFPGTNERDKINRTFRSAPPWLMWFTFADYTAELLGLDLPDLSDVRGFKDRKRCFTAGGACRKARLSRAHGLMALTASHSRVLICVCCNSKQIEMRELPIVNANVRLRLPRKLTFVTRFTGQS